MGAPNIYMNTGMGGQPSQGGYMSQPMPQAQPASQAPNLFNAQAISNLMGVESGILPGLISNAATAQLASTALNQGAAAVQSNVSKWFGWLSLDGLKPYFHVDNKYVKNKIKLVAFPYPRKEWTRQPNTSQEGELQLTEEQMRSMHWAQRDAILNAMRAYKQPWAPPVSDVIAPDLYLPVMAFITYVLLRGYSRGLSDEFHPELLSSFASSAFFAVMFEMCLIRFLLFLAGANSPPGLLDILAYSGYKFVGYCLAILLSWTLGSVVFYLSLFYFALSHGVFLIRLYHPHLLPPQTQQQGAEMQPLWQQSQPQPMQMQPSNPETLIQASRRKTFLLIVLGIQIVFAFLLVRGAIPDSGSLLGNLTGWWR